MMDYSNFWGNTAIGAGLFGAWMGFLLIPLMIWGLFWKGWALWKASKNDSKVWFIVMLVLNTVGILEILYIFVFSKKIGTAHKKAKK